MAQDNKTEEATPRRREKERNKGNIAKSQDLNSAITISAGCALMAALAAKIIDGSKVMLYETFTHLRPDTIPEDDVFAILVPFAKHIAEIMLPFLIVFACKYTPSH